MGSYSNIYHGMQVGCIKKGEHIDWRRWVIGYKWVDYGDHVRLYI